MIESASGWERMASGLWYWRPYCVMPQLSGVLSRLSLTCVQPVSRGLALHPACRQ